MKAGINFILIILLMSSNACSQNYSNKLTGSWLYKGTEENKNQPIECPDVLEFNPDGNYSVLNDCYGNDIEKPNVEHGRWVIDSKENNIILKDRKFSSSYTFHDSSPELTLYLKEITDKSMKICFNNKSGCNTENYTKEIDNIKSQNYSGKGSMTNEQSLTGKESTIKLNYDFYGEPDQLIIENQNGRELFKTEKLATNGIKTTTVKINSVTKLVFKIKSEQPNSKWRFKVEVQ